MSLFVKFNLILILVFAVALVPAGYISNSLLQKNARTQIVQNARIMMQTAMATRGYTVKQIKPLLAPRLADEFLPQSVPAYSATEIFNYLREKQPRVHLQGSHAQPDEPARPDGRLGSGHRERVPREREAPGAHRRARRVPRARAVPRAAPQDHRRGLPFVPHDAGRGARVAS